MNKLETNALRIAELMGWRYNPIFQQNTLDCNTYFADAVKISSNDELIELYSNYQGLMPIVFECNSVFASNVSHEIGISRYFVSIHIADLNQSADVVPEIDSYSFDYNFTEPEFIEALQLAVIKYLELKNG